MKDLRPARSDWVDVFRGLAIILVALGHVIGGLGFSSFVDEPDKAQLWAWYAWIYSFHMPAFFAASGLFALRSLRRSSPRAFIGDKLRTLLYPYLLWGAITWGCHSLMTGFTNTRPDPLALLKLFYNPPSGPWFLYVLFTLMLLLTCWDTWSGKPLGFLLAAVAAYAAAYTVLTVFPGTYLYLAGPVCRFGIYFAMGIVLSGLVIKLAREAPPLLLGGMALGGFAIQTTAVLTGWGSHWLSFLPALGGTVELFGLAVLVTRYCATGFLQLCGRHSLEIYLVSGFSAVPIRLALHRGLGLDTLLPHLVLGTAAGVLVPLGVVLGCKALKISYLFGWGHAGRSPSRVTMFSEGRATGLVSAGSNPAACANHAGTTPRGVS